MIRGLSHSVNLGISFLTKHNLKLICTEEEVALMPAKDGSASRALLIDRGCHCFISLRSGKVLKATEAQRISTQVWRIPCERICINAVSERPKEAIGVYAKDKCSIPTGMGKYIPAQTNCGATGYVLIEICDKNIPGLVLPEIVYNVKKKLGCIFVENHNSEPLMLKRGQMIGLVTSCVVMQDEQGQTLKMRKEDLQSVTGQSNDMDTRIGGPRLGNTEKGSRKADSVHCTVYRKQTVLGNQRRKASIYL